MSKINNYLAIGARGIAMFGCSTHAGDKKPDVATPPGKLPVVG
jgi:hypothetical protein